MPNQKINESKQLVRCAVGIVFNNSGKILIAKRPAHKLGGEKWEFPGGKIEASETAAEALSRELQEEVGITPIEFEPFLVMPFDYPEYSVELHFFLITKIIETKASMKATVLSQPLPGDKSPSLGLENQIIAWVFPHELANYSFLEANKEIVAALQRQLFNPFLRGLH